MSEDRLQHLFGRALEQEADNLDAFLAGECGQDRELLRALRELLAADRAAEEQPIWHAKPFSADEFSEQDLRSHCGERIGPYRIVELIGAGGMGAVYRAIRDDSEYRQSVAIKLVKRGMDTDSIIRRFRNERQILANLEHASIARLLDGGTTEDGLPYLVMEFIDGQRLNDYCRDSSLTVNHRLRLFRAICSAVHYAHQHLVIHRDLKPGNILVTADGTPKLLDFGIARILTPEAGQETINLNERALTPGYASPEQIEGKSITTASDVFSLGVILYEMLTGQSPYGTEKRTAAELMRMVCNDQPERPSSKRKGLKGDLDNIVLMALRKEPERRYASVEQLSEDVNRHLELLPVRARGNDFRYAASRFIRRNWLASAALVLIAASLVIGMVTTARAEARAERRFEDVRQMAHSFVFDYYDAIETLPGATPVRHKLVQEALRYLDSLSTEADSVSLELELVQAYVKVSRVQGNTYESNLGDGPGALASVRKAIAIGDGLLRRDRSAETFGALAGAYLDEAELLHGSNELEAADKAYGRALQLAQSSVQLNSADPELMLRLIRTERHMGDLYGAEGTANLGRSKPAAEMYRLASVNGERLLTEHPTLPAARTNLYDSYVATAGLASTTGQHDRAEQGYEKALAMIREISAANTNNADDRLEIAGTSIRLAREFMTAAKPAQALPYFKDAESIVESLCRQDPKNVLYKRNLSVTEVHIGNALMKEGDDKSAVEYFSRALAISASLATGHSQPAEIRNDMALAERKLGQAYLDMKENRQAQEHVEKSLTILDEMAAKSNDANLLVSVARSESLAGEIALKMGNKAAAVAYAERAHCHFGDLVKADPANAVIRAELAASETKLASYAPKLGR